MTRSLTVILLLSLSINCIAAEKLQCSRDDAIQAESEAAYLKDWKSLCESFKRFAKCDDASIAEGYSASVGRLLALDGNQLEKLYAITKTDKEFERFVIKHVDETVSTKVLIKIIENVRKHCPNGAESLCNAIDVAASKGWDPKLK